MRRKTALILSLILLITSVLTVMTPMTGFAAPGWPEPSGVEAEGACLMDASSGTVIYGKNMHETFYPASITKILTALLVIENCDLDEEVEFSHRAVFDVESGSSSAGYDVGDKITVKTALYALLLKSANEAANALAEHTAGSIEAFCDMMNERAKELGCTDTHFANPSGLNNENHYTSAYDFCLIARAAFENDTFVAIDGTTYYTLPPSIRNPEPQMIYAHHSMLKKSNAAYYPGIIGGKTGYTSLAGNTLVTCAEKEGLKLICVVLNGHQTHYTDTKLLLDFGFDNFRNVKLDEYKTPYETVFDAMDITGKGVLNKDIITVAPASLVLPKDADMGNVSNELVYTVSETMPPGAIARIDFQYADRNVGCAYLERSFEHTETFVNIDLNNSETEAAGENTPIGKAKLAFLNLSTGLKIAITVGGSLVIVGIIFLVIYLIERKKRHRFY